MRAITRILVAFVALTVVASVVSALVALVARDRMQGAGEPTDDEFDLVAIFDGRKFESVASAFRRGSLTAWYGSATVDMRGATLDPAGATLDLRAIFGGCRLVIPETWCVELSTKSMFGGIADSHDQGTVPTDGPVLRIRGLALFGGIVIASAAPDVDRAATEDADEPSADTMIDSAPLPA